MQMGRKRMTAMTWCKVMRTRKRLDDENVYMLLSKVYKYFDFILY